MLRIPSRAFLKLRPHTKFRGTDFSPYNPEPPVDELGRYVPVTWVFSAVDEGAIDRFEIVKDATTVVLTVSEVTERSATVYMEWDHEYTVRSGDGESVSEVAAQIIAVFAPGLARGKTITASSANALYPVTNALDGRASTYWLSVVGQTQWVKVDLGAVYDITAYRLKLGTTSYAKAWVAEVSSNDVDWTTIDTVADNTDTVYIKTGLSASGRYVRWSFTESASTNYLISELEVTGS